PGDDGSAGQAAVYDMRYSTSPINEFNWNDAHAVPSEPTPHPAGSSEIMIVGGLQASRLYYFAIKAADEIPNWSDLSNVPSAETAEIPPDETPPSAVDDLAAPESDFDQVLLTWTETGDDGTSGTASSFELRMADFLLNEDNWPDATIVAGVPAPSGPFAHHEMWVRNLDESSRYFFGIKVIDESGNASTLSNVVDVTTPASPDTVPPPTIVDLRGTPFSAHELDLEWTAPGDGPDGDIPVEVYEIRVQTSPLGGNPVPEDGAFLIIPVQSLLGPGDLETRHIEGLSASTTYYCSVRSRDAAGNWSESSNEVSVTTLDEPPPPPPQGDETPPAPISDLAASEIGIDFATLTWTATGDDADEGTADHYELRMSSDPLTEDNWEEALLLETGDPQSAGAQETLRVEGLESGATYYFALQAYDLAENPSGLSNLLSVETDVVLDEVGPFAVTDLAVIDSTETSLSLRWTTPADTFPEGAVGSEQVVEYELRYALDSLDVQNWELATIAPAPEPREPGEEVDWTISDLDPGQTYGIALRSRDLSGNWSELSNILVAWTQVHVEDPPPPPPPDESAPGPVTDVSLSIIDSWSGRLGWTATGDDGTSGQAASYRIRRLAGTEEFPPDPDLPGAWDNAVALSVRIEPAPSGETETFSVTGLSPGWFYSFGIVAVDEAGNPGPVVWSAIAQTPYVEDAF
ncbi:MAG: fibronectin type III domain-containing protein, partial [Planctomycetes bacterium]|nr:fibronectin type III domain-containing protein [Planctomycetota bacterium]